MYIVKQSKMYMIFYKFYCKILWNFHCGFNTPKPFDINAKVRLNWSMSCSLWICSNKRKVARIYTRDCPKNFNKVCVLILLVLLIQDILVSIFYILLFKLVFNATFAVPYLVMTRKTSEFHQHRYPIKKCNKKYLGPSRRGVQPHVQTPTHVHKSLDVW